MKIHYKLLLISLILLIQCCLLAQSESGKLTEKERAEIIDSISNLLQENYVFPEVADKMATLIKNKHNNSQYQSIIQPEDFAEKLTQDLQSISNDKHLRVIFDPEIIKMRKSIQNKADSLKYQNDYFEKIKNDNFGFKEIKILDGNIGYLDLRIFSDTRFAGETAVAAMSFLINADAIIIDLRNNRGGSPTMIQLITSYFFSSEPVHLIHFYWRPSDTHTQTWTLPYVPGKRRPDIDLYILTSSSTFSAAEEFSYNLKILNRAILVGETTGGGTHPGGAKIATKRFMVWIPSGRAINPITKTNWEGTGVEPHIKTTKEAALDTAIKLILEKTN